jgi:hypothetical protein
MVEKHFEKVAPCAGSFARLGDLCGLCDFARNQFVAGELFISGQDAKTATSRKEAGR